jgi:hypothetical protein
MCKSIRELAVIGHQDQSFTFIIQPAHRVKISGHVHKITHGSAPIALLSLNGSQYIARLVQRDVDLGFGCRD